VSFTIQEYIEQNKLGVDHRDSAVAKKIAAHLRNLGYHQIRVRKKEGEVTVSQTVWVEDDRKQMLDELQQKLDGLKKRKGGK
jgi:vacuolar-type H+-ATPase subunit I/STV1